MVKPKKFDHFHLVYHVTVVLKSKHLGLVHNRISTLFVFIFLYLNIKVPFNDFYVSCL